VGVKDLKHVAEEAKELALVGGINQCVESAGRTREAEYKGKGWVGHGSICPGNGGQWRMEVARAARRCKWPGMITR